MEVTGDIADLGDHELYYEGLETHVSRKIRQDLIPGDQEVIWKQAAL